MKRALLLSLPALLIAAIGLAQDAPSANAAGNFQDQTKSSTAQGNKLRGCLSGSEGNFTLTDLNGMQYRLVGNDMALKNKVGHEVEVNVTPNRAESDSGRRFQPGRSALKNNRPPRRIKAVADDPRSQPSARARWAPTRENARRHPVAARRRSGGGATPRGENRRDCSP